MMEDEVVRRRGWMSREAFLDLVGASHLIPGPNSTELAIHVGYARARWAGLVVAGTCFILPALAIVWVIAAAYVRYGSLPAVAGIMAGVKPVVMAVIGQALWGLGRTALKSAMTLTIFVAAVIAIALGVHELWVLAVAAAVAIVDRRVTAGGNLWGALGFAALPTVTTATGAAATGAAAAGAAAASAASVGLATLFLVFLKAGALLFGSGYVLLAFLEADLVQRLGWLSQSQLLDAIAVGQSTPGPVFTTATFVGYVVAGHPGALIATVGIFLPAFVLVALTAPVLERLRANADLRALLDGVNAASLAMMAMVTIALAVEAFPLPTGAGAGGLVRSAVPVVLCGASLWLLVSRRVNSAWLVLGGAAVGVLLLGAG